MMGLFLKTVVKSAGTVSGEGGGVAGAAMKKCDVAYAKNVHGFFGGGENDGGNHFFSRKTSLHNHAQTKGVEGIS